ncbi:MAG: PhoH family protein [Alphaproteobacteria bacterium]|nr:PhoH family protein [Alphaproteobacteria bacterium]MCW5752370.1 PhoH family protein [Alphaproteobacteria bacterium]
MVRPMPPEEPPSLVIDLADNRAVLAVCGEHDRNLARIEQKLNVSLRPRGNRIAIAGDPDARAQAETVLRELQRMVQGGHELTQGDIDGVIRYAAAGGPAPGGEARVVGTAKRRIQPRSLMQARYIEELQKHELVFGLGPAGTGKTYLAVAVAVADLLSGRVDRIILSRPAVEAGERLGFLPGDMREKVDPYLRPLYDALYDMLPGEQVQKRLASGEIEVAPLAFMRGRTLANAYVILDEAQNTTPVQMKMLLTRLGENSRMAVTGDLSQVDLPIGMPSGLRDALGVLEGVSGVSVVRFGDADVVRHPLVTRVVRAYAERDRQLELRRKEEGGRER